MRLEAVFVGTPQTMEWQGREFESAILKNRVYSPLKVRSRNIEGDGQADLRVHGGEHKAVYAYSAENYLWWRKEMNRDEAALPWGAFGENLLISDFDESKVCVGDRFQIGDVILEASEPRMPCFKLAAKFRDDTIVKRFLESGRLGIYFRVEREGTIFAPLPVEALSEQAARIRIFDLPRLSRSVGPSERKAVNELLGLRTLSPKFAIKLREALSRP